MLTPENRRLLALIRDRKPGSVAELADLTGRAQPNLTRTLAKLEAAGFISMKTVGRRKTPSVSVKRIVVEIDPALIAIDFGLRNRAGGHLTVSRWTPNRRLQRHHGHGAPFGAMDVLKRQPLPPALAHFSAEKTCTKLWP